MLLVLERVSVNKLPRVPGSVTRFQIRHYTGEVITPAFAAKVDYFAGGAH
jgi:hypothetical protein